MQQIAAKICVSCGRAITWRKKWARNWDDIKYCSDACRRPKMPQVDQLFESATLKLLREAPTKAPITCEMVEEDVRRSIKLFRGAERDNPILPDLSDDPQKAGLQAAAFREAARRAARRLAARSELVITQGGQSVDPSFAKGVMELSLP